MDETSELNSMKSFIKKINDELKSGTQPFSKSNFNMEGTNQTPEIQKISDELKLFCEKHYLAPGMHGYLLGVFMKHSQSLSTEIEDLKRWKAEQIAVTQPLFDYMQNHKEIALGESMVKKIVEFAKERDYLKLKLSGKTFSCPVCDSMAERIKQLEEGLRDLIDDKFSNREHIPRKQKIEQLLSNQNNKK